MSMLSGAAVIVTAVLRPGHLECSEGGLLWPESGWRPRKYSPTTPQAEALGELDREEFSLCSIRSAEGKRNS